MSANTVGTVQRVARPTMKDVAALAGVGLKTVSRVVNGERHVSEATRIAVERAIAQLNFQRNDAAANLRQGQSATIGLIVEDISEPVQASIARAVEQVAMEQDSLLLTASSSDDPERERQLTHTLISRRVDGLIVIPSLFDHGYLQRELNTGLAVVFVDRPPLGVMTDAVLSDNRGGAYEGTRHLIENGHRRIAFIGDPEDIYTGHERLQGYRGALLSAGLTYDERLVHLGRPNSERVETALRACLALEGGPATALVTGNSLNTIATLRAPTYQHTDVAHVAFDDLELADLLRKPLTVVAQAPTKIGQTAAERLFSRINGLETGPAQTIYLPTHLLLR